MATAIKKLQKQEYIPVYNHISRSLVRKKFDCTEGETIS